MASIFVEQKDVAGSQTFGHLYLVYNDNGTEYVLRGGPGEFLRLVVEFGLLSASSDARGDETPQQRGANRVQIDDALVADSWALMTQVAREIEGARKTYLGLTQNSNSTIATLLASIGIDIHDELPVRPFAQSIPGFDDIIQLVNTLSGSAQDNILVGQGLDDTLRGSGGEDRLYGDLYLQQAMPDQQYRDFTGKDTLFGDAGDDFVDGGAGRDKINGGGDDDTLLGGWGADQLAGGAGNDTIHAFWHRDYATLSANGTKDDAARDRLDGGAGDDVLIGGRGRDTLDGGDGNDSLDGGTRADKLDGGRGSDTYYIDDRGDTVHEIGRDVDTLYLQASGRFDFESIEKVVLDDGRQSGRLDVVLDSNQITSIVYDPSGADVSLDVRRIREGYVDVEFGRGTDRFTLEVRPRDFTTGVNDDGFFWGFNVTTVGARDRIDLADLDIDRILTQSTTVSGPGRYLMAPGITLQDDSDNGRQYFSNAYWAVIEVGELPDTFSPLFYGDLRAGHFII